MNDLARRIAMDRDYARRDKRGGRMMQSGGRGEYSGNIEYTGDYARSGGSGRGGRSSQDGRQGVKGTGRYGIGGSRYYGRRDRAMSGDYGGYDYDYENYGRNDYGDYADYADYGEEMRLNKEDMKAWKRKLENADGSLGEHFDIQEITNAAEKVGVKFDGYDEKELCMTANMLYSDYCEALKTSIPPERESMIYTKMAKAFLEDEDGPEGSEKLALYYRCIVEDDE